MGLARQDHGQLADAGIKVALGDRDRLPAAVADLKHPEILPVTEDGTVLNQGGRQAYAVSSPLYREYALTMTRVMAERYQEHPALAMWHIDNEMGCHVPARLLRPQRRLPTLARGAIRDHRGLNEAWGTAFWSQRYDSFEEILPPLCRPHLRQPHPAARLRPLLER